MNKTDPFHECKFVNLESSKEFGEIVYSVLPESNLRLRIKFQKQNW